MFAVILIFSAAVILPTTLLWWLFRRKDRSIRTTAAIIGAELLVTPAMFYIAQQEATSVDSDPWIALVTVAVLALLVGALVVWGLERVTRDDVS
jgi:hypothetical protein